ncbi:zinc ribbon domain-containing protein [Solibacillus daqui]|uniref:zinc ribbon domain-containing protein n=1 Tax=Solibacillus daqui TaxID=2912187 RepID=UPI0023660242|nr:zinc ribbon domain-containing protein [Solibacillus daqui]
MKEKEFITQEHIATRNKFRTLGPIVLGAGILCVVIAGIDFFTLDFFESPKYFYLFFIGLPLLAIGFYFTGLGYGSKLAAYQSREMAPVAKDTFNYLANETTGSIEKIAQAAQKGKSAVVEAKQCGNCQELNKIDAKFCNECGNAL